MFGIVHILGYLSTFIAFKSLNLPRINDFYRLHNAI